MTIQTLTCKVRIKRSSTSAGSAHAQTHPGNKFEHASHLHSAQAEALPGQRTGQHGSDNFQQLDLDPQLVAEEVYRIMQEEERIARMRQPFH